MAITRLSPGVYSNNGRVVQSTTKPGSGTTPKPAAASGTTPAPASSTGIYNPFQSQYLQKAESDLRGQVASGGINQGQMDAELGRLRGQAAGSQVNNMPMNTGSDLMNSGLQWGRETALQGNQLTNANQQNPFGSQQVTYDPITGQPQVNQSLSSGNQSVVSGVQGASTGANSALQSLLGGGAFGSLTNPGEGAPQSNYEKSVFDQLTRGVGEQKAQEKNQLEQSLANRGIPVGSEAYTNSMRDFDRRYDDITQNARSQAVTQANNQLLSSVGTLSGVGQSGFYNPSFQPFQAAGYNPSVTDVFSAITGRDQNQQTLDLAKQQAARAGGGGRGSSGGSRAPSPPAFTVVGGP